jgi:Zn-dependent M28 family amino/carboxypeptidase
MRARIAACAESPQQESVTALLEIAQGVKAAGGTDKDILFVVPSAEEEGLKGSEAFVKAPPVPLERIVGCVNFEMLGQNAIDEMLVFGGKTGSEAQKNPLYGRALRVGAEAGTPLKPGAPNDDGQGWFERSDHLVFANSGIPSVMFHGRAAPGTYHTDDDTLESLDLDKVRLFARDALRLVCDLGNDQKAQEKKGTAAAVVNPYQGRVWPGR